MENNKQQLTGFALSFVGLCSILAMGPYLTLKTAPALGTLLTLLPLQPLLFFLCCGKTFAFVWIWKSYLV